MGREAEGRGTGDVMEIGKGAEGNRQERHFRGRCVNKEQ